jgi:hypothetical protein
VHFVHSIPALLSVLAIGLAAGIPAVLVIVRV